jgi:hypothetical protein
VTFVTASGEEQTLPTPADGKGMAVSLFEQLAQEAVPVWLETSVTPRSKRTVISAVHRQAPAAISEEESNALDAEIAAKDQHF